ncbi:MAG: hypothetical protein Q8K89_13840 [Actinomycetota bacterium]|nr:hypothetical protein [Actinomycetota bacterium]
MKKVLRIGGVVLAALLLAGSTVYAFANAPEKGSMGVWGYIASPKNAALDVSEEQIDTDELTISRVTAPEDAWIVVHLDDNGMPGERIGFEHLNKGINNDVRVKLEGITSEKVIVAVHADKGTPNELDFDMEKPTTSPDRPFFVDGMELAMVVTVREFGVKAEEGQAAIEVADQPGATDTLVVDRAVAPTGAWVVVHLNDDGMPGERVGFALIPAGESSAVEVTLDSDVPLTDSLFVAVHADRGAPGTLEFDMEDKLNSPDQPFFVNGDEVATKVSVK